MRRAHRAAAVVGLAMLSHPARLEAQREVVFTTPDSGRITGDVYGSGDRAVVVIGHGGYSTRLSWRNEARVLADAGYRTLVFDTRAAVELAAGRETDCLYDASCMATDVLAAVRYMRTNGAKSVSVLGGSAGGGAAAQAAVDATDGEIDRIILLAPMEIGAPERIRGRKLYITSRHDLGSDDKPRLPGIRAQYDKAPGPKKWVVLEGSAHGQRIFGTDQSGRVRREILRFLREP